MRLVAFPAYKSYIHVASQAHKNRAALGRQRRVRRHQAGTRSEHPLCSPPARSVLPAAASARTDCRTAHWTAAPASWKSSMTSTPPAAAAAASHGLSGTEVEVKLRLPDSACWEALCEALLPCFKQSHEQENFFFDGAAEELSSQRVVLRLRFYDTDRKAVITVKGKQVLADGVGTAPEEEETVDAKKARAFLSDPDALLASGSSLIDKLKSQFELKHGLSALGGFYNLRREYVWRGHLLELDQTSYPWGTLHELECETARPEETKKELEELLKSHGIPYSYSTKSKFANFKDKTLE